MKLGLALVACIAALGCGQGTDGKSCRVEADELTRWLVKKGTTGPGFVSADFTCDAPGAELSMKLAATA